MTVTARTAATAPLGAPAAPSHARRPHRLRFADVLGVGTIGLRAKRVRTALTALGIAIGIAAMVAVVGISASSRADLLAELDRLGTNHLQVAPGNDPFGEAAALPTTAPAMIRRVAGVQAAAATRLAPAVAVRSA